MLVKVDSYVYKISHYPEANAELTPENNRNRNLIQNRERDIPTSFTGSRIRKAEITLSGSLGNAWSYLFKLNWTTFYVKYAGLCKDSLLYFGQVLIPFGLENVSSSKWSPFLERSLATYTFSPGYGIGFAFRKVFSNTTLALSLTTNAYGGKRHSHNEPLQKTLRFTYVPLHTDDEVTHFGMSIRYLRLIANRPLRLLARPEFRLRNDIAGFSADFRNLNYCSSLGLEFAKQWGPFSMQSELISSLSAPTGTSLNLSHLQNCYGGYIQGNFILTGETRGYDFKSGTFGRIRPTHKFGAFDVALRYSCVNLQASSKRGVFEQSINFALGWTPNNHVRIFANYIIAKSQSINQQKRLINFFGLRLQWLY